MAHTTPTTARAAQMFIGGVFSPWSTGGGGSMYERITGCKVTTLMKIDTIQKLEKMETLTISGMGATAMMSNPMPSVTIEAIAGAKRWEYETTMAWCRSFSR